jgi:UrcA family protein
MKSMISATHYVAAGVIAGAFTLGFISGPAFAQAGEAFKFKFEQSELASVESATKLLTRLENQAKKFCKDQAETGTRLKKADPACITATMDQTVAGFKSDTVAQIYKSRTNG